MAISSACYRHARNWTSKSPTISLTFAGDFGNTNHKRSRYRSHATRGYEQAANSSTGLNLSFDVVTLKAIVTLLILAAAMYGFVSEKLAPDVTALLALLSLLLTGVLTPYEAFSGFSHPATISIAAVRPITISASVRVVRPRVEKSSDTPPRIMIGGNGSPEAEHAVRAVGNRVWPAATEVRIITVNDGTAPARIREFFRRPRR